MKKLNNQVIMPITINKELKDKFEEWCIKRQTKMSQYIRSHILQIIENDKE